MGSQFYLLTAIILTAKDIFWWIYFGLCDENTYLV
jgi:hypothetical protein